MKVNYPPRPEPWNKITNQRLRLNPEVKAVLIPNVAGSPSGEVISSTTEEVYRREWTGTVTPGFGSLPGNRLPVNPHHVYMIKTDPGFSSRREVWISPGNPADSSHRAGSYLWTNGSGSDIPPLANHLVSCRNVAIKRLMNRVSSNSNLALDILEIGQLQRTVYKTAVRIRMAVTALRRGNIPLAVLSLWKGKASRFRRGGGPSMSKSLAENWLEMQYGWKPLLSDAKGAAENLARIRLSDRVVCQIKASANQIETKSTPITFNSKEVGRSLWERRTQTKFGLRYRMDSALATFLAQSGFTNPLNLAWEVLPFSFVVDWFAPIGPYLEALHAWDGLSFLDGYETSFTRENFLTSYSWAMWLSSAHADAGAGYMKMDAIRLDRLKLTTFPSLEPPVFKNPFSQTHALNALALLKVAFARR